MKTMLLLSAAVAVFGATQASAASGEDIFRRAIAGEMLCTSPGYCQEVKKMNFDDKTLQSSVNKANNAVSKGESLASFANRHSDQAFFGGSAASKKFEGASNYVNADIFTQRPTTKAGVDALWNQLVANYAAAIGDRLTGFKELVEGFAEDHVTAVPANEVATYTALGEVLSNAVKYVAKFNRSVVADPAHPVQDAAVVALVDNAKNPALGQPNHNAAVAVGNVIYSRFQAALDTFITAETAHTNPNFFKELTVALVQKVATDLALFDWAH